MSNPLPRFPVRAQFAPAELKEWFTAVCAWLEVDQGLPKELREKYREETIISNSTDRILALRNRWYPEVSDYCERIGMLDEELASLDFLKHTLLPASFVADQHCPTCLKEFVATAALNQHFMAGCKT